MVSKTILQKPIAVSVGDPCGIGPDTILESWSLRRRSRLPPFYVVADPDHFRGRAAALGLDVPVRECKAEEASSVFINTLPVVPLDNRFNGEPGIPDTRNSAGILESIERAVTDVAENRAAAVVTAPIAKKPLYDAGFPYPGHTEFLGMLAERLTGKKQRPVMMLAGPKLRTVPVTIHIPLSKVSHVLTTELIVETCEIIDRDLRTRFEFAQPRLALAGLNPHAGEGGALGTEDGAIILPAVEALRKAGIDARGPFPADTMFHDRARAQYDVAVCMYHDQALIPAKALGFDEAVNITLGLPFIRTSPDHGTAYELAGSGRAMPDSLVAAIRMASAMAGHAESVPVS